MKSYLQHKADFPHKLGIKFYMISLTLLLVNQFPNLAEAHWGIYLAILIKRGTGKSTPDNGAS